MATSFLQKTAYNSIAIWQPSLGSEFNFPLTLSQGTGVDEFLNIDTPQNNLILRPTMNRNIYGYMRPVLVSGTVTLHPQSTAISSINGILDYQDKNGVPVYGVLIVISVGTLSLTTYSNFVFSNPFGGPNINKVVSDVVYTFQSKSPSYTSIGGHIAALTSALGIFGVKL